MNKQKVLLATLCCLLWGTAIPVLKVTYTELQIDPMDVYSKILLAGIRFLISGFILLTYALFKNKSVPKMSKNRFLPILYFGILNTTLQYIFFYMGVANTGAIEGVLLDTSKPLIVIVLAHFLLKNEPITKYKVIGLIIGFTGILVASVDDFSTMSISFSFFGEGMLLISSFVNALAVIYGKKIMKHIHYLDLNTYQFILGSIILLVIGYMGANGFHLNFTTKALILLIYSGFLSAVAFAVWYKLINQYTASSVTIYIFLIPVFGSIISSLVFVDEVFTIGTFISLILVSFGIILVNSKDKLNKKFSRVNPDYEVVEVTK
jgi:drug/metabolite transporter (DMT)-like permease